MAALCRYILAWCLGRNKLYSPMCFLASWTIGLIILFHFVYGVYLLNEPTQGFLPPTFVEMEAAIFTDEDHIDRGVPYITDTLCMGCRHAIADLTNTSSERCGVLIEDYLRFTKNSDVRMAAQNVARLYPIGCSRCSPSTLDHSICSEKDYRFWRYDSVLPTIRASFIQEQWLPSSKPFQPFDSSSNLITVDFFTEYNPSIVVLPWNQMERLELETNKAGGNMNPKYYYLSSFRVSNQNYCFHRQGRPRKVPSSIARDYLGIAVLEAPSFQVRYDTVVDLKAVGFHAAQDFRLFAFEGQVYVSTYDMISPLWVTRSDQVSPHSDAIMVPTVFYNESKSSLYVWIRKAPSCVICNRKRGYCGKNFNYFMDPEIHSLRVEMWPSGPHTVRDVDLNGPCQRQLEPSNTHFGERKDDTIKPSFPTLEELDFPSLRRMESILTRGRGGACCVPFHNNDNRTLYLGIQHSKTPSQRNRNLPQNLTSNHYLSSLYAFEPTPPYRTVAQSGWFCLGFPSSDDSNSNLALVRTTSRRKLVLGGRRYDCPRIQFVSGMILKAGDPDTVIVAYGLNDCLSRFVEFRLADLIDLLFLGPKIEWK
jgi:hypothetical protein